MAVPPAFANFDIDGAGVAVWLFKKSGGAAGAPPTYTGRWVDTDANVEAALRAAISEARAQIEEIVEYGLLAQNNEGSALGIDAIETHADLIVQRAANPLPQFKVRSLKDIQNSDFYVVKLTSNGEVLHAVRKTDGSWKTRRRSNYINVLFKDDALELEESPEFSLSKYVDFFILNDRIYIKEKANFESVLNYKQAHADDFVQLQAEPGFAGLFTDLAPLVAFVGSNKIQLRRVCAIRQKGHYQNAQFVDRLRQHHAQYQLNIIYDGNGLIEPTPETCSDIITALLDHRLLSAFSDNIYDVPDTTQVA